MKCPICNGSGAVCLESIMSDLTGMNDDICWDCQGTGEIEDENKSS